MSPIGVDVKKLKEIIKEAMKDESEEKDIGLLLQLYQEAKKAGLDKISIAEIDGIIKEVKEEIKEEARERFFAMTEELKEACKDIPDEELERAIDQAVIAVRQRKKTLTTQ